MLQIFDFNNGYERLKKALLNSNSTAKAQFENDQTIHEEAIVYKDETNMEIIKDLVCVICLGVARLPGKICKTCEHVYCGPCFDILRGEECSSCRTVGKFSENIGKRTRNILEMSEFVCL